MAPGASLYADAYVVGGTSEVEPLKAIQHVWTGAGGDVRAINNSWGKEIPGADGGSQLTLGVDWLAHRYDTLLVFSINSDDRPDFDAPGDNFNGITVGASERVLDVGFYRQARANNDIDFYTSSHYEVDLLAPGKGIEVTGLGGGHATKDGSSLAAPHVVGTVALLQQYVEASVPGNFSYEGARHHEVMKAILLNSADKLPAIQGSPRRVLDEFENDWTQSNAAASFDIPLDEQMGAGHLNARRALNQLKGGPFDGSDIGPLGWDYGETGGEGTVHRFHFAEEVSGYVTITLAWDRIVEKFGGSDTVYGAGDLFIDAGFSDLDLFLLPVGWQTLDQAVAKSVSTDETVEHIFAQVPAGDYEIVVEQFSGGDQVYGLAWWAGSGPLPGDFDDDGDVDEDDLSQWKGDFGQNGNSDADGDGDSDGADFAIWQQNLGQTSATINSAVVPEPASWALIGLAFIFQARKRKTN